MLTAETVQKLQQADAIRAADATIPDDIAQHALLVHQEFSLTDLEHLQANRRRARGTFKTPFVTSFCEYVMQHQEEGCTVFLNPVKLGAVAVLNMGTPEQPGHADNTAELEMTPTAEYFALLNACGSAGSKTQQAVAEFLEDWQTLITCYDESGAFIDVRKAVAAIRAITLDNLRKVESKVHQLNASQSTFESVAATSEQPIPTRMVFTCVPYFGLAERRFEVRVGVTTTNDKPGLTLRLVKQEAIVQDMCSEVGDQITDHIKECPIVTGTYSRK